MFIGSDDGRVHAVNGSSGAHVWSTLTQGRVRSSPAILPDGSAVIVGSDDGHLYALSAVNGSRLWSLSTGGPIASSPTLSSDGSAIFIGAWDGVLLAVRSADGSLLWRTALVSGAGDLGLSSAVFGPNGTLFVSSRGGTVHAVSASSGIELWRVADKGTFEGAPSVSTASANVFAASFDGQLHVLQGLSNGSEACSFAADSILRGSPALTADGLAIVATYAGSLHAVNVTTELNQSCVAAGGNASTCDLLPACTAVWSFAAEDSLSGSPALDANGTVYIGDWGGTLYAVNGSSGVLLWRYRKALGAFKGSPAITANGTIVIGSLDGAVYGIAGHLVHSHHSSSDHSVAIGLGVACGVVAIVVYVVIRRRRRRAAAVEAANGEGGQTLSAQASMEDRSFSRDRSRE